MGRRSPAGSRGGLEGSYLPQGSGDGQSPEELRAQEIYAARMWLFENAVNAPKAKRKVSFNDYVQKNCEEAWAGSTV